MEVVDMSSVMKPGHSMAPGKIALLQSVLHLEPTICRQVGTLVVDVAFCGLVCNRAI